MGRLEPVACRRDASPKAAPFGLPAMPTNSAELRVPQFPRRRSFPVRGSCSPSIVLVVPGQAARAGLALNSCPARRQTPCPQYVDICPFATRQKRNGRRPSRTGFAWIAGRMVEIFPGRQCRTVEPCAACCFHPALLGYRRQQRPPRGPISDRRPRFGRRETPARIAVSSWACSRCWLDSQQPPYLRLTPAVTDSGPRLGTRHAGSTLPRWLFQPLAIGRLVAH